MAWRVEHIVEEKKLKWSPCVGRMFGSGEAAKKIEVLYKSQCDGVACYWHRILGSYGVATFERSEVSADMYTTVAIDRFPGIWATTDVLTGGVGVRAPNARGSCNRRGSTSQVHVGRKHAHGSNGFGFFVGSVGRGMGNGREQPRWGLWNAMSQLF